MRILIDLQGAQNGSRQRGIGRYSLALARGIVRVANRHKIFILLNGLFPDCIDEVKQAFRESLAEEQFLVLAAPGPVRELSPENAWRRRSAELLREMVIDTLSPDVVLTTSMIEGAEDDSITSNGILHSTVTTVSVIYDLIPFTDPERYIAWEPARIWYHGKLDSLRRADLLLAISEATRVEATRLLGLSPQNIVNISSAADTFFSSSKISAADTKKIAGKFRIARKYLMHSSAFEARKNFQGLIRAFASLPRGIRAEYQLVLVCKLSASAREELSNVVRGAGLEADDVILTGYVTDDELVALYSGCQLFVFPSFQEGFGLPALEAMCCGTPTIGSNVTSIPEVIGREDALFDPTSDEDIAAVILKALTDASFYSSLKAHAKTQSSRFSWDATARRALTAIEDAVSKRSSGQQQIVDPTNRKRAFFEAIAKIAVEYSPNEHEILDLARAIEANQSAVDRMAASAAFAEPMTWRVEGPFDSSYSLSLLNRETARALSSLGHTVVLHSTEGPGDFDANALFLEANADIRAMHAMVSSNPHEKVDIVSRNLYPPRVADMSGRINLLHHYAWEESGFPQAWVNDFNAYLDGMTCLSTHVEKVLLDNGVCIPMTTSGCGIDHWERVTPLTTYQFRGRAFRFLHVSSCFPRKGIDVLLSAFGKAFTNLDDVSLVIKTFQNPHNNIQTLLAECKSQNPHYPDVVIIEGDLSDEELKSLYQQCHALVAPSRAEGFGLPLAEAMLSGLAVITTNWSGQLDFCTDETAWLVDYRFELSQTHFKLPDSVWALPNVDALAEMLTHVRACPSAERIEKTAAARRLLLHGFLWRDVAARLVLAAKSFQRSNIKANEPRIGWVTTWNTKCGIATYSEQLIERFPQRVTIFAPRDPVLVKEDGPDCVRSWSSSKDNNHFDELALTLADFQITVLIIQFNYGFYNFPQLKRFLLHQIEAGRSVIIMMHATGDPGVEPAWNWQLVELLPVLRVCHRLLVHTVDDLNRLKNLGLVSNVSLFPHGILESGSSIRTSTTHILPLIATYGFCLPHKGLMEIVSAAAILRDEGNPIRLRLVNAEYPNAISSELITSIRRLIKQKQLDDIVEIYSEFLPDKESLRLLQEADIIVYPYQQTNESASGAVRLGLASRRPVAVTPIQIFDELSDSVHRFPGTQPADLAVGIRRILSEVTNQTAEAEAIHDNAEKLRSIRGYAALSKRLHGICKGLAVNGARYHRILDGSSPQMRTSVGHIVGRALKSSGTQGFLMYGQYLAMAVDHYIVVVSGFHEISMGAVAYCDVCTKGAKTILGRVEFTGQNAGIIARLAITVREHCDDLEIRVFVDSAAEMRIDRVEILSAVDDESP